MDPTWFLFQVRFIIWCVCAEEIPTTKWHWSRFPSASHLDESLRYLRRICSTALTSWAWRVGARLGDVSNTCPRLSLSLTQTAPIITAINTWGHPTGLDSFPNISGSINNHSSAGTRFKDWRNGVSMFGFKYEGRLVGRFGFRASVHWPSRLNGEWHVLIAPSVSEPQLASFPIASRLNWLEEGVIRLLIAVSQSGLRHKSYCLLQLQLIASSLENNNTYNSTRDPQWLCKISSLILESTTAIIPNLHFED